MRRWWSLLILSLAAAAHAQTGPAQYQCFQGGVPAKVQGINSTNYLNGIVPSCRVEVFLHGTTTHPTAIYADSSNTPLSNPFTGNALGSVNPGGWIFWAATNQAYDVTMSGGIPPNAYVQPVTLTIQIGGGGGGGGGCTPSGPAGNFLVTNGTGGCTITNIQVNGASLIAPSPVNFVDSSTVHFTNPVDGQISATASTPQTVTFEHNDTPLTGAFAANPAIYNYNDTIPAADANFVNATGKFDPATGRWNVEVPATSTPAIQMYPIPPDTNQGIFVPFTVCALTPDNVSLLAGQSCTRDAGSQSTTPGGLFNHNAHPSILFSVPDPTILAGINPANITAVYAMAWLDASGSVGYTFACSATGVGAFNVPWSIPNGSQTSASFPVSGANIGSAQCQMQQSQSVNGDYGATNTYQSGLWVEYTGTPVAPTKYLNIKYPLSYSLDNNTLTVNPFWPDFMFPRLFANLPGPVKYYQSPAGWVTYLVSDNSTVTVGQPCAGTGTPSGPPYSLCTANGSQWIYDGTFGGSGPPAVSSVQNSDGSLTISPTAGAVVASINVNHTNTWNPYQVFEAGFVLDKSNSPVSTNGDEGTSGECFLSSGTGLTPHWGVCGGGTIGGSGTAGFYALWSASTTLGNGSLDDGITLAGWDTFSKPVQVVCSTCATQVDLTYNSGHAPTPGSATTASFAPNTSGQGTLSEAGAAYSRICTAANGVCSGSGSLNVNGTPVSSPNLQNSTSVTYSVVGSNIQATTVGGAWTNISCSLTIGSGSCSNGVITFTGGGPYTVSSIPGTYNHLHIVQAGNLSTSINNWNMSINGGPNFACLIKYMQGTATTWTDASSVTNTFYGGQTGTNGVGTQEIDFPFYASSLPKNVTVKSTYISTNANNTNNYMEESRCGTSQTSAITSLQWSVGSGTFIALQVSVYGIN